MDIDDIVQYTHKMKTITINNKNVYSLYENTLLKITLNPSDVKDDEVVRFSINPDGEWIEHEQFDDDFYCYIPNKINSVYNIYVHFFPSHLYTYTQEQEIFSIYDFKELYEALSSNNNVPTTIENQTFQHQTHYFGGTKYVQKANGDFYETPELYNIEANIKDYTTQIDDEGRLIVKAYASDSVTKDFDPNYKQFLATGINKTQQGMFPLASKYRSTQDWGIPKLNKLNSTWKAKNNKPFWEVRINRIGLSPLITSHVYGTDLPVNVLLNYEYLPSSREYHQHYYGFEPDWNDITDDEISQEKCNAINVFEGTNINSLSDAFGTTDNTYRLINWGNPYDNRIGFKYDHYNNIPINLKDFVVDSNSCTWTENVCDHYWKLSPKNNNIPLPHCYKEITLKENQYYTLKFYIYIPSKIELNTQQYNSCYVSVQTTKTDVSTVGNTPQVSLLNNEEYKINDAFLKHDKDLRNQWIYHEIAFKASETNRINIYGAPYLQNNDQTIYIINMSIEEMVQYSPTIKYTNRNVMISEHDKSAVKSLSDKVSNTTECPKITYDNKKWTPTNTKKLPTPYSDINIISDGEKYVFYDPITTNIYYTHPKYVLKDDNISNYINNVIVKKEITGPLQSTTKYYKKLSNDTMQEVTNTADAIYSEEWDTSKSSTQESTGIQLKRTPDNAPDTDKDIKITYSDGKMQQRYTDFLSGIRGKGNKLVFNFQDTNGNFVKQGKVEIGIFETKDTQNDVTSAIQYIIRDDINGIVSWENIDFSLKSLPYNNYNLQTTPQGNPNQYYVRISYIDTCMENPKTIFKTLLINDEKIFFGRACGDFSNNIVLINDPINRNINQEIVAGTTYTINDERQFPIRFSTYVMNNNNSNSCLKEGWCELYINDDLHQSTLVDKTGKVDFYLNFSDLSNGKQTIKIEYYRQYNIPLAFIYFDLNVKNIMAQDVVFVEFYRNFVTDNTPVRITDTTLYMDNDDFIAFDVVPDPTRYEYNCEIWINNERYVSQNFYGKPSVDNDQYIPVVLPETKNYNIKIITKDIITSSGKIYTNNGKGKFKTYEKELNVIVRE